MTSSSKDRDESKPTDTTPQLSPEALKLQQIEQHIKDLESSAPDYGIGK